MGSPSRTNLSLSSLVKMLVVALVATAIAQAAHADPVTYVYESAPFNFFEGDYSCSGGTGECGISITLTLAAPLAPNVTTLQSVAPLSWSVSDGANTITNATPTLNVVVFQFATGPDAGITAWNVEANSNFPSADGEHIETLGSGSQGGFSQDSTALTIGFGNRISDVAFIEFQGTPNPVTWHVATTPEPGTNGLLLVGAVVFGGLYWVSLGRFRAHQT